MAIKSGTYGLVQLVSGGDNTIASLQDWTLEIQNETTETTVLGDTGFRRNIATFTGWSVESTGFWDDADTAGQIAFETAVLNRAQVTVKLYPSATNGTPASGDKYYTGDAWASAYSPAGTYDDAVRVSLSFVGEGVLTVATEV